MCCRVPNNYRDQFAVFDDDDKICSYPWCARNAANIAYEQDVACGGGKIDDIFFCGAAGRVVRSVGAILDTISAAAIPLLCLGGAAFCICDTCAGGVSVAAAPCYPKGSDQRKRAVQSGLKHCGEGLDACVCTAQLSAVMLGRVAMDVVTLPANLLCHEAMNSCQPQADLWCNQAAASGSSMFTDAFTAKAEAIYKPPLQVVVQTPGKSPQ